MLEQKVVELANRMVEVELEKRLDQLKSHSGGSENNGV
jgi:hypothetical protein